MWGGGRRCFHSVHSLFAACAQRVRSLCAVVDRGGERVEAPHENEARAHMPALIALQVACVSIRQHTSAYVSGRQYTHENEARAHMLDTLAGNMRVARNTYVMYVCIYVCIIP